MKNYTITVNGNVYNVTVEEGTTAGAAPTVSAGTKSSTGSTESSSSGRRSRQRRGYCFCTW